MDGSKLTTIRARAQVVAQSKDERGARPPSSETGSISFTQKTAERSAVAVNPPLVVPRAPRSQMPSGPGSFVSTTGLASLAVSNRTSTYQRSMHSVYGYNDQYRTPSQGVGSSNLRRTDALHYREEYEEGVVFSVVMHEQHFRQDRIDSTNQSETNFGIVNSKFRKFVVLAKFHQHVIALPILTHQGNGLSTKYHKNEFISIREGSLRALAAPAESTHGTLWSELYPRFIHESTWHRMGDTCCLHITKPFSHQISHKSTISGKLEPNSFTRLKRLFKDAVTDIDVRATTQIGPTRHPRDALEDSPTTPTGPVQYRQRSTVGAGPRQSSTGTTSRSNLGQYGYN